jgi:hypothetical protein
VIELAAGAARTGITITVDPKDGVIRGTVVGADGNPTADAWVTAEGPDDDVSRPVLSTANGGFTIDHLGNASYRVVATGPRGASHGEKNGVKTGESITIQLTALGTLAVRVAAHGAPVTSYDLACRSLNGEIDRHVDSSDGTYELEHLAPGGYECTVQAQAGSATGHADVPGGAATVDLELRPYATITGTVVSVLTGQPVPGIYALAGTDAQQVQGLITGSGPVSDAGGRFTIEHVTPGQGTLTLFPKSAVNQQLAEKPYTAEAGAHLDLGAIPILPPRTGEPGTLGMATELGDGALAVAMVQPGGPAAQAGIVVGDRVTAIDGHSVVQLTPATAQQLVASGNVGAGQTLALTLQRGVTVSVTGVKW